jgi:cobalt/nickel transport system permease protein
VIEGGLTAGAATTPVHRLDARAKILGLIVFAVVVVTTPPEAVWAFILYAFVLAFVAGLARLSPLVLARRALVVIPFVIMVAVFLPFFHQSGDPVLSLGGLHVTEEGLLVLWNALAKALLGVLSMILLGLTTTFSELVTGFERLRLPKVLVLTVSFMHRYSHLFLEESQRMQRAMASRDFHARWLGNVPTLGRMLGSLFLRSYSRGERVYVAMVSRGYEGTIHLESRGVFGRAEVFFVGAVVGSALAIRIAAAVWSAS